MAEEWTLVEVESQNTSIIDLPMTFEREYGEYIVLKKMIPETEYPALGMRLEVYQNNVWVYVEDELLYEYIYTPGLIDNKAGGSGIIMINLPSDAAGKELYIEYGRNLEYYPVKIVAPVLLNASIDNGYVDSNYLWIISAMISYLLTGIFLLCSYFFESKNGRASDKAMLRLSGIFISVASWMLCYNKVYTNISESWVFIHIVEYVSFYTMPYFILLYMDEVQSNKAIKLLKTVAAYFAVATIWLKFLFGIDYLYFLTLSHILMMIHILAIIVTLAMSFRKGPLSYKMFAVGISFLIGSTLYGLANIHVFNSDVKFVISFMIGITIGGLILQLSTICLSNEKIFDKNSSTFKQNKEIEYSRYESILEKSGGFYFDWNKNENSIYISSRMNEYLGIEIDKENFTTEVFYDICKKLEVTYDFRGMKKRIKEQGNFCRFECEYKHDSGETRWFEFEVTQSLDDKGEEAYLTGLIRDITDDKLQEDYLLGLSREDQLTGLLNKKSFLHDATAIIKGMKPTDRHAFFVIDVDNFKNINDTFGHLCGDQVIIDCAQSIRRHFRKKDLVSRFGGDEYIILMREVDMESVERKCKELNNDVQREYTVADKTCKITLSIGVAVVPEHGTDYETIFRLADNAVYESKKKGRNTYTICND